MYAGVLPYIKIKCLQYMFLDPSRIKLETDNRRFLENSQIF